jgi:hypothetical protein
MLLGNCSVLSRVSLPARLSSRHFLRPTLLDCSVHSPHRLHRGRDGCNVLEKLLIGAAAGASGWTYAVMNAIFLRNGDYSDRASQLLATFCNLMLSRLLRSQVWLRTRSVFVPKILAPSESGTPGIASLVASPVPRLVNALALLSLSLLCSLASGSRTGPRSANEWPSWSSTRRITFSCSPWRTRTISTHSPGASFALVFAPELLH